MRAHRRRRPWRKRAKLFWIYLQLAVLLLLAIGIGSIGGAFYSVWRLLPSGLDIAEYRPTEATQIISSDGILLAEIFEENRKVVPITDIPKDLQNATIAIEDERFYRHFGVDMRGIVRAVYQNMRRGRMSQGGSTLTQQLARNIFLTREKKLSRKLQEMVLALQLERKFSKQEILELYLNQIYYGSGSYGVETAAQTYFGKHVKDLTLAECAMLSGLPQKPSSYSPHENLDAAVSRRNTVLDRMAELEFITQEQRDEAKQEDARLIKPRLKGLADYKAPWFVTYAIKELTNKYGADLVYHGGLKVYTTLNYQMQKVAEKELREGVAEAKWRRVSQGALVCIDPYTGYIKAMVGGVTKDFTKDQYNRAVQARRQPGSAFKAFVYTAAIDNGFDPRYRVSNRPIMYNGKPWPKNYTSRQSASSYTIRQAIAQSVNRCAVRMTEQIGVDQVINYARMLGIKSPLERNYSLALGAYVVTPLEICSAYGVFATNGMRAEPMSIVRIVESDGAIIEDNKSVTRQVLSQQTSEIMNQLFRAVITDRGGTGYAARLVPNAHGKTGTTSDDRDAWFIGYTPELVTAVWVGNDDYRITMKQVFGGNVCAPTWTAFMQKALEIHAREKARKEAKDGHPGIEIEKPEQQPRPSDDDSSPTPADTRRTVTICVESGLLATQQCPITQTVPFDMNREELATCTIHRAETPSPPAESPVSHESHNSPVETAPPALSPPPARRTLPGPTRPGTPSPRVDSRRYVGVTICVDSGQVANAYCPETITRQFLADEAPTKFCRLHRPPRE